MTSRSLDTVITRRGFLGGMLALAAAPAIVRASSLMPVVVRKPIPQWALPWITDGWAYDGNGLTIGGFFPGLTSRLITHQEFTEKQIDQTVRAMQRRYGIYE